MAPESRNGKRDPRDFTRFDQSYECTEEDLGRGVEGTVKTCVGKLSGREFAVKTIQKRNDKTKNVVLKELDILNLGRRHANIVELMDAYEEKDCFRLVFTKMDKRTMSDQVYDFGAFTEEDASMITRDVATALEFLHSHRVVHRDLKLENILVTPESFYPVQVCDFGLSSRSRRDSRCDEHETEFMSSAVGTVDYIAPEVANVWLTRTGHYTEKCDMWSLGVVLFIIVSGERPFCPPRSNLCCCRGRARACEYCEENLLEYTRAGAYSMGDRWMDISDEAIDLVSKLLEVDPDKRYNAQQVLQHPWIRMYDSHETSHKPIENQ